MRRHNLSLVLRTVRDVGAISRSELAERLGLSGAAMTRIVNDLLEFDYLDETTQSASAPGRPRVLLAIKASRRSVIAIDFRVDRIVVESVDFSGATLYREQLPQLRPMPGLKVVARLAEVINRVSRHVGLPVIGIGLSAPASYGSEKEKTLNSLYLDWEDIALTGMLQRELGLGWPPIVVEDVAQCAALANVTEFPQASGVRLAHIQIGIGAGIGLAGEAYGPLLNSARHAELGRIAHLPLAVDGPLCACGATGCLDSVAGFPALVRASAACNIPLSRDAGAMNAYCAALLERHHDGDSVATNAIVSVADWLGRAAAAVLNLCGPNKLTIGGYPLQLGELYLETFLRTMSTYAPRAPEVFVTTRHGDNASVVGAARLALRPIFDDPLGEVGGFIPPRG